MANDLTDLAPKILAQGLLALREFSIMPRLVNGDYSALTAQKGHTIDVPIPSAIAAQDVTPSNTPPSTADVNPTIAQVVLNQWKEAPFYLTDKDLGEVDAGIIPMQASEAVKAIANTVDAYLLSLYTGVYGFAGVAGTTPFGTDTSEATLARKILNNQLAPMDDRRMLLNPDAEAQALNLRAFQDTSYTGDAMGITKGIIGEKLGFLWFMDQNVPDHTSGTLTANVTVTGANAVGATTINVTTDGTGVLNANVGDIITFAGDTQTYAVGAATTIGNSSSGDVSITPPLKVATVGSEAVAMKADHAVNLAFHRDAIAFAVRPLEQVSNGLGNIITQAVDPVSGLSMRLEISREHKRTRYSYDILYGATLARADLATRVPG